MSEQTKGDLVAQADKTKGGPAAQTAVQTAAQTAAQTEDERILISFAVPCYNAADYMDRCIESILAGARNFLDRIQIIIVNDGSNADDTAAKADDWQKRYPDIILAVHQENGGHGEAVNTGMAQAAGLYFKVVDADDWLDEESLSLALVRLKWLSASKLDMLITNYVYEQLDRGKRKTIRYTNMMPEGRVFTWADTGSFKPQQNLLMHAIIYRTQLLRDIGLHLPSHTFYVDNVFAYVPLPDVKSIFYLDTDLYRYYIGREGQSVSESTMIKRVDQQLLITRLIIDAYQLRRDIEQPKLRKYMIHFLTMMMTISTVFLRLSKREDAERLRQGLWEYLKLKDPTVYAKVRGGALGLLVNLPGGVGKQVSISGYRIARRLFKFN